MSSYGPHKDSPNKLARESNTISVELNVTGSTGTISWSIPANINSDAFLPEEYDGILLVVDTKPITAKPTDSKFYQADNTVDTNKHVGDTLDSGLVVAAVYNDKKTNSVQITDLLPNTNYYVAAFASDNVRRYGPGVFSYAVPYETKNITLDTAGHHKVKLGVLPSDETGLLTEHTLKINIDGTDHTFTIPTVDTYADLVTQLNLKFAQLDNVSIGTVPPNTNAYTIINNQLSKWDGYQSINLECFFGNVAPNAIADGTLWFHNKELFKWVSDVWVKQDLYSYIRSFDTITCGDVWFDGTNSFKWDGYSWKKFNTLFGTDPSLATSPTCGEIWFNHTNYYKFDKTWKQVDVYQSSVDPTTYYNGYYWYNNNKLHQLIDGAWTEVEVYISESEPVDVSVTWYKPSENKLKTLPIDVWVNLTVDIINTTFNVLIPGDWYWLNTDLFKWDEVNNEWDQVTNLVTSSVNPNICIVKTNDFWYHNNELKQWDGSQWIDYPQFIYQTKQPSIYNDAYWYDGTQFRQYDGTQWNVISVLTLTIDVTLLTAGQFWFNTSTNTLSMWNGAGWVTLMYGVADLKPVNDAKWYDYTNMYSWNGSNWVITKAKATAELVDGMLIITSGLLGSKSKAVFYEYDDDENPNLFHYTSPVGQFEKYVIGTDHISTVPMYKQTGVGTDGTPDERRALANNILMYLGYPSIQIELDKAQVDLCIDMALASFRKMSASAYERSVFFLDLEPNIQSYLLTDGTVGLNKIVDVQAVYRRNSSFMSASAGNGIYAQQFLQWLYAPSAQMDLTSYHIISQYIETMEILFAVRLVHRFNERQRRLDFYQNIGVPERVLVDCTVERTEQDLFTDRTCSKWLLNWASAEACHMLANIRGKYGTVPGAGGSVSLNAGDMQSRADALFERCHFEIDNYIANEPENIGLESTLVWG